MARKLGLATACRNDCESQNLSNAPLASTLRSLAPGGPWVPRPQGPMGPRGPRRPPKHIENSLKILPEARLRKRSKSTPKPRQTHPKTHQKINQNRPKIVPKSAQNGVRNGFQDRIAFGTPFGALFWPSWAPLGPSWARFGRQVAPQKRPKTHQK